MYRYIDLFKYYIKEPLMLKNIPAKKVYGLIGVAILLRVC